jgi:RimJ/RimL family protein N-acetyltransferase
VKIHFNMGKRSLIFTPEARRLMADYFDPSPGVPVIETARLRMRPHRPDDFSACAAMWSDAGVTRYIGGRPFTGEEVWARLLRYAGHWAWMGFGFWAVEEKDTGDFIGEIGFAHYRRDIDPPVTLPELGWALAPWAQGKGYATEGVRAAIGWGDARFGSSPTVCLVHPENLRSIKVAAKCGYRELQRTTYKGQPTLVLSREV